MCEVNWAINAVERKYVFARDFLTPPLYVLIIVHSFVEELGEEKTYEKPASKAKRVEFVMWGVGLRV